MLPERGALRRILKQPKTPVFSETKLFMNPNERIRTKRTSDGQHEIIILIGLIIYSTINILAQFFI
jgi:hypothetical protein